MGYTMYTIHNIDYIYYICGLHNTIYLNVYFSLIDIM